MIPLAAARAIAVQFFLKESSEDHFQVCEAQIIIIKDNVKTLLQQLNKNENQYRQLLSLDYTSPLTRNHRRQRR